MAKGKLWTPQELLILEECVKSSKTHTEGYKKASKKLGRSERACTQVFLKRRRNKYSKPQKNQSNDDIRKLLYENIQKNPGNLQEAFRITAKQTGKNATSIEQAYYSKTHFLNRHKNKKSFMLLSKEKMAANSKIFNSAVAEKTTKQKIKHFIAELFGITKEDLK